MTNLAINRSGRTLSAAENAGGAILVVTLIAAILALATAFGAFIVWLTIDAIAGYALSFREAVGGGLLLVLSRAQVQTKSD